MSSENVPAAPTNFIRQIIDQDLKTGKNGSRVATRFPPEPNGYLHIGHAKSICLNFGIARDYNGSCNLRYDDTNPAKEDVEYVDSIERDVKWLGFEWTNKYYASDYFEALYQYAVELVKAGKAFVCDLNAEQMREHRGTLTQPGRPSPFRERPVQENLDLLEKMRRGLFEDGARTLRAKIDMASPNINLRDPVLYRIKKVHHHRTGDKWCIYPMYDYAHSISDALERITHSICTLEFEDHRPLYDWCLDQLQVPAHPQQIEFSRLNISYTMMSKRKLLELVQDRHVTGWDDPRMPTIIGFRRRGYTPEAIRDFADRIGVTKKENCIDVEQLESCIREDLDRRAPRAMVVIRPLKVVIDNYPEGQVEEFEGPNHPSNPEMGSRKVPFSKVIYIEQEDFVETPQPKFFRLAPGKEVRLRFAYFIKCESVVKDATGAITEVHCTYDPASRGGNSPDGRKVKGTIHWVSAAHAVPAEIRLYDRLFTTEVPGQTGDYLKELNSGSLETLKGYVEPSLATVAPEARYQFERLGYFCADMKDHAPGHLAFNRTVTLRDSWAKIKA
ncbi:MAG TPA: glutamine--tRNA ligase [Bdellovibrionales bacterium]|nr:MAG: glutamine--tRNA ligase [Bdellovibrionales bacterium GWB1_52_6]OFZ03063.1 MAG: glutamine--tRNA ligase [Bdellovibrionales bacterium GWA1_52_35]OFZ43306.1 MAG: glutamine--tRNA ligase [Bdellovibrionales bacterium GWC1_52_8]HAR43002.1 glutamine--tRNA ligase [Bdellovibrionales bacterium]HCM40386.1 glutamine--tRNA ligase [Bdellovibrionales bacterium]